MKIVVIDDDELDYRVLKRNLERAYEGASLTFEWIQHPEVSEICAAIDSADLCFVDYRLGDQNGIDIILELCEAGVMTPLVLLTGESTTELDERSISAGAADFLHKDRLSVSSIARLSRHCLARKQQEERLAEMAYTDQLTGLKNRAAFDRRCGIMLQRDHEKHATRVAMITFDLDDFKLINDNYGHPAGDEVLKVFSTYLSAQFRSAEIIARLGGDEFGVILRLDGSSASEERLRDGLRSSGRLECEFDGEMFEIKSSVGIAVFDTTHKDISVSEILKRCDRSLYSDKRLRKSMGSNQNEYRAIQGVELSELVSALELAIRNDDFTLCYQPKVSCISESLTGMEALLRWPNPKFDLGPAEFIPVAEEFGLISALGRLVISKVCKQIRSWQDNGFEPPQVAVNVTPKQLEDDQFADMVEKILDQNGIDPCMLEFELTEGAFDQSFDVCLLQMVNTAKLGCRWAIDDFGVGYSSLSRIHKLPISRLKIDKTFLSQIPKDPAALAISNTIISMARDLGMSVVAEGVEDLDQLQGLNLCPEDQLQGYYYFHPLQHKDMEALFV